MGATINSAYNVLLKKLVSVEKLKYLKEKKQSEFVERYKDNLFCPNYEKGCRAKLVFAVRKGTPYLRTHPDYQHHKNPNICPLEKTKTGGRKRGRRNRNEKKEGEKERYFENEGNIKVKIGNKSIEKIQEIIERIKNKTKKEKSQVAYELPEQQGVKKTARYTDANAKITKSKDAKSIEVLDGLRELRSDLIKDIHINKHRVVYGEITQITKLKNEKLSVLLTNNFRIVFSKEELEKMKVEISEKDIGKVLIVPVIIRKSKKEFIDKFGNPFYGRLIKGLEAFVVFQNE